jgi:hypothetical protein
MRQRLATSGWRSRITSGTRAEPGVGLVDPARMRRHEPPRPSGTTQLAALTPGGSVPRLRVQAAGPSGTSRTMRRYPSGESSDTLRSASVLCVEPANLGALGAFAS